MNPLIQSLNKLPLTHGKAPAFTEIASIIRDIHREGKQLSIQDSHFELVDVKHKLLYLDFQDDTFIDDKIVHYIKTHIKKMLVFTYTTKKTTIRVTFAMFNESKDTIDKYKSYCKWITNWFMLCVKHSESKCHKSIRLHLYLTHFTKTFPSHKGETLGEENANSAYTYPCKHNNKIVLFRQEEWFKVLIHESFHYFDLENIKHSLLKVNQLFPISTDILLGEAYAEFWARIINSIYVSYDLSAPMYQLDTVKMHFERVFYIEQMFSSYQAVKVLHYMGLDYTNIIYNSDKDILKRKNYKEETNIFAYYVITSLLMHCSAMVIKWCKQHNHSLMRFNKQHIHLFINVIERCRNQTSILENFSILQTYIESENKSKSLTTMRMTLLDFL